MDVVGHRLLAEAHAAQAHDDEHDGPLDRRVREVEVDIAHPVPGRRLVLGHDVLQPQEVRHPGRAEQARDVLEDAVAAHQPRDVDLAGPQPRHLPVQEGGRCEVPVDHVVDPGIAPAQHRLAGVGGPVLRQVAKPPLDERAAAAQRYRVVVPRLGVRDMPAQRILPRLRVLEEGEVPLRVGHGVQRGQRADGRLLQAPLLRAAGLEQPALAAVHDVVGDVSVNAAHDVERRPERRRVGLDPDRLGHRDAGELPDQADHLEFPLHLVAGEYRHVHRPRGDPGDQPPGLPDAAIMPGGGEEQGLAGLAGGRRRQLRHLMAPTRPAASRPATPRGPRGSGRGPGSTSEGSPSRPIMAATSLPSAAGRRRPASPPEPNKR